MDTDLVKPGFGHPRRAKGVNAIALLPRNSHGPFGKNVVYCLKLGLSETQPFKSLREQSGPDGYMRLGPGLLQCSQEMPCKHLI